MKTYQEKPISLILRNSEKKYEVNPQALQFFNSLEGKVAIISVAGIYRTGKSFLLNKMILNSSQGFAVGPTTNAKTKGIWVWGKPLISHNQNNQIIQVVVLDSEGLGSTEQDINHDLKLFSVTLLMSSAFLYNTVGSIDQNAIDSLGLVLRLCQHLKTSSYNDFPDFYWILRDFSLALVDKDGKSLTTKQYLQNCLCSQPGDSQIRNKIRGSIRDSFLNRYCVTFVRPLTDQGSLQNLDKMQLDQLRPEFVQQVIDFRKMIFQSLKTKTIKGKEIKGQMLCDLISLYVAQINGDKIPVIQTGWKYVCQKQCQNVLNQLQNQLTSKISNILSTPNKLPTTHSQFLQIKQQIQQLFLNNFKQKTKNNDQQQQSLIELKQLLKKILINYNNK